MESYQETSARLEFIFNCIRSQQIGFNSCIEPTHIRAWIEASKRLHQKCYSVGNLFPTFINISIL